MVSTRKKRQSSRRLLSQLDDHDQDIITGNAATERQENIMVYEGTNDRNFTVGTFSRSKVINEIVVNVKTLETCLKERIDREMNKIFDTVEDRIRNATITAIDNFVGRRIELAICSINASSGRDVTKAAANSEGKEHVGINASCDNASGNNNVQQVPDRKDETRNNISDEVSELSFAETHFHRQTRSHHMVTGQTTQTNQVPEFYTGRNLTPRNPPLHQQQNLSTSHKYQNLSTQVSQDNVLPMVEQTPRNQNSDANNSIIRIADAIAGIATQ